MPFKKLPSRFLRFVRIFYCMCSYVVCFYKIVVMNPNVVSKLLLELFHVRPVYVFFSLRWVSIMLSLSEARKRIDLLSACYPYYFSL